MASQYPAWLPLTRYTALPLACLLGITNISATFGSKIDGLPQSALLLGQAAEGEIIPIIIDSPAANDPPDEEVDGASAEAEEEVPVLIAEVEIISETGELSEELRSIAYDAIRTRPGETTTRSTLQEDINAIFATGYFSNVKAVPEDVEAGVRVTFITEPNPVLTWVIVENSEVLPERVVDEIFGAQYGKIINLVEFQSSIAELNNWYLGNGYSLAQVTDVAPEISDSGEVVLQVAEGVIEAINIQFLDSNGSGFDENGNPVQGETKESVILREIDTQPGDVFQQEKIQDDLEEIFALGIFNDVSLTLSPSEIDPRKTIANIQIVESNSLSIAAGAGFNFDGIPFLSSSLDEINFRGLDQELSFEAQLSSSEVAISSSITSSGWFIQHYQDELTIPFLESNSSLFRQAFIDLSGRPLSGDFYASINTTEKHIAFVQEILANSAERHPASFTLLCLINLGNLYTLNDERENALSTYQEALKQANKVNSPAAEFFIWLKIAGNHRSTGAANEALISYQKAWNLLPLLQSAKSYRQLLGTPMFQTLSAEWDLENRHSFAVVKDLLELFETTILLDIAAIRSSLGDYQQASYTVTSPLLDQEIRKLDQIAEIRLEEFFNFVANETSNNIDSEDKEFNEIANGVAQEVETFLGDLTEISRESVEEFIDYDLSEQAFADDDSKSKNNIANYIPELVPNITEPLITYAKEKYPAYNDSIQSAADFTLSLFDRDAELSDQEIVMLIGEAFAGLVAFEDAADFQLPVGRLEDYEPLAKSFYPIFQKLSEQPTSISLNELILEEWSESEQSLEDWQWVRGTLLKFIADSLYDEGNYQQAIEKYQSSEGLLATAPDSLKKVTDAFIGFNENDSDGAENPAESESVARYFEDGAKFWVRTLLLDSIVKQADAQFAIGRIEMAQNLYSQAIKESAKINEEYEAASGQYAAYIQGFRLSKAQVAELHYKQALSEQALGQYSQSQTSFETAIATIESASDSFKNSTVSSFTNISYGYGYGIPNLGKLTIDFKLSSNNPWSESQPVAVNSAICETLVEYFSCRQQYFESYINMLYEQHIDNPEANFDLAAFEQNERARTQAANIFQTDAQQVSVRKQLLNETATLEEIQQELDDETLLLEFFLGEEESYLWVISNNEPLQMIELPPRDEIETTARAFYDLLTEPSGRVRPETTAQAGDALSRLLFAEVKDEINAHERLVIVGDGFLQYLPFAALPNPAPESSPSSAAMQGEFGSHLNPLLLEHEVILLPSASALVAIRQDQPNRTEPEHELAMFANPVFSHKNSEAPGIALAEGFELTPNTELDDVEVLYSELPTTAEQLADIEPLIPASDRIQYLKHDADLEAALSPELGDYRIVHFATHGIFNSRAPERSGIVLSAISEEGILQPGLLSPTYAFNGMNLDSTELVVLSGCRTGLSNSDVTREGLTGLTGGLFAAGADRVVASLWSVQDTATQELMGRFYERMLDPEINMTPAEALRDAQISMWNEPQWQTPYYWAAFTLQGEWQGWN